MKPLRTTRKPLLIAGVISILFLLGANPSSGQPSPDPPAAATGRGAIGVQLNSNNVVLGNLLEVRYQTLPGTLQGNVDIYFAASLPTGQLLFLTSSGGFTTAFEPLRRNVTVIDETVTLFSFYPVDTIPFGTYTLYMALVYAGADATDSRNWASNVSVATLSFTPLSPTQRSILQQRGNPDFLAVIWVADLLEKRESWLYVTGTPTSYEFLNGSLQSQTPFSGTASGTPPRVNPNLFTPQTTLQQLIAAFGPPTTVEPLEGTPDFQIVNYAFGLNVVISNGRLAAVSTSTP
jgi:hypothetical protein